MHPASHAYRPTVGDVCSPHVESQATNYAPLYLGAVHGVPGAKYVLPYAFIILRYVLRLSAFLARGIILPSLIYTKFVFYIKAIKLLFVW